jgi:hypothetical protein
MANKTNVYKILIGKPGEKRYLGRPRRKCENIKMNLAEIGLGVWVGFTSLRMWTGGALVPAFRELRVA